MGGFFRGRPTPDFFNPQASAGPRSIHPNSSISAAKRGSELEEELTVKFTAHDGLQCKISPQSQDHLTAKHGHDFGIDDQLSPNLNQKLNKYPQRKTRVNKNNKSPKA